jgi:hypothetical protein
MEIELRAKAARKLNLLVNLANKLESMYGEKWERNPHPTCSVTTVYINLFKEINVLADEIEKLLK